IFSSLHCGTFKRSVLTNLHDLRRTGKTAMSEHLGVAGEVSEAILNHGKQGMDAVYNNAQYIAQKLEALTTWEDYVMAAVNSDEGRLLWLLPPRRGFIASVLVVIVLFRHVAFLP